MSRVGDGGDWDEQFPNEWAFWERRRQQVLSSRAGYKALSDLRAALLALPEKRLIARALSTVGKESALENDRWGEARELLTEQGEGVCAVGAYAWYQRVKAGADPREAMAALPLLPDYDSNAWETVLAGRDAGLQETLAWIVVDANDEQFAGLTPEERYEAVLRWIDETLAAYPEAVKASA